MGLGAWVFSNVPETKLDPSAVSAAAVVGMTVDEHNDGGAACDRPGQCHRNGIDSPRDVAAETVDLLDTSIRIPLMTN